MKKSKNLRKDGAGRNNTMGKKLLLDTISPNRKIFSIPKVENFYNIFPVEFQNCGGQHPRCYVSLVLSIYD